MTQHNSFFLICTGITAWVLTFGPGQSAVDHAHSDQQRFNAEYVARIEPGPAMIRRGVRGLKFSHVSKHGAVPGMTLASHQTVIGTPPVSLTPRRGSRAAASVAQLAVRPGLMMSRGESVRLIRRGTRGNELEHS